MAEQNRRPRRTGQPPPTLPRPRPLAGAKAPADRAEPVRVPAQTFPRRHRARGPVRPVLVRVAVLVSILALATWGLVRLLPAPADGPPVAEGPAGEGVVAGDNGQAEPAVPRAARAPDAGEPPPLAAVLDPPPGPQPALLFAKGTVTIPTDGFLSWAVMDRRTGEIWGSANLTETTWPASMIKSWIAADYLRRASEGGRQPSALGDVEIMIRDSDNNAAIRLHSANGGNASIRRMVELCGMTDTTPATGGGGWSFTNISAQDTVRLADCIADGTAAGPQWTGWLLDKMRSIRIGGWGIRDGVPPGEAGAVSIKNGWLRYDDDGLWHINCLAVADTWAMSVLQRYRGTGNWNRDFSYGQQVCGDVAIQLTNPAYSYAH